MSTIRQITPDPEFPEIEVPKVEDDNEFEDFQCRMPGKKAGGRLQEGGAGIGRMVNHAQRIDVIERGRLKRWPEQVALKRAESSRAVDLSMGRLL